MKTLVLKIQSKKKSLKELNEKFVEQGFNFRQDQLIERKEIKREIKLMNKELYRLILTNNIAVIDAEVVKIEENGSN